MADSGQNDRHATRRKLTLGILVLMSVLLAVALLLNESRETDDSTIRSEVNLKETRFASTKKVQLPPTLPESTAGDVEDLQVRVIDHVSEIPLKDVMVSAISAEGAQQFEGFSTDAAGSVFFPLSDLDETGELVLQVPDKLGGSTFKFSLESEEFGKAKKELAWILDIDVFARLRVIVSNENCREAKRSESLVRAIAHPRSELLPVDILGADTQEALERREYSHPEIYWKQLRSNESLRAWGELNWALSLEVEELLGPECVAELDIPYTGDLAVTTFLPGYVPNIQFPSIVRGEISLLTVELREQPWISGTVYGPDGEPVPYQEVSVAALSFFDGHEPIPRAAKEPLNPSFISVGKRWESGEKVCTTLTRRTDKHGRFRMQMPLTDEVAAYCFVEGFEKGLVSRKIGDREESVEGLDIVLSRLHSARTMQVLTDYGEAASEITFQPVEKVSRSFIIQYPKLHADENGIVDVSFLDSGVTYFLSSNDRRYSDTNFDCENNGRIYVTDLSR